MALPGALCPMVIPNELLLDNEFNTLQIPPDYRLHGDSCFGDGGTSSYCPYDMCLDVGELYPPEEGHRESTPMWVQSEIDDVEIRHEMPLTLAIVLDDPQPPYDPNFMERPALTKFFNSCWGALRANANEDREDMAGNPCFTMWSRTPERHWKWLLRFDAPLEVLQDMFEAGRENARAEMVDILERMVHCMSDCD